METRPLPENENIYDTPCPILFAMKLIGHKWKLPILWYIAAANSGAIRYRELERKVVGITPTMLTKCLREMESDGLVRRKQYNTIPPAVEYSLAEYGRKLIPALDSVYTWGESVMEDTLTDSK